MLPVRPGGLVAWRKIGQPVRFAPVDAPAVVEASRPVPPEGDLVVNDTHHGVAAAVGWIRELDARAEGIWALVEWTLAAAETIRARAMYVSPTVRFGVDADGHPNGHIVEIVGGGLVERTATVDQPPIRLPTPV